MKLSVACNFDKGMINALGDAPVYEFFGKMTVDSVGGGRSSFVLPTVRRRHVEEYTRLAHKAGIQFNYLLNAACLANIELTGAGQRSIRRLLDWLQEIGVDSVTLVNPLLLRIVKDHYSFKARIGIFAGVNSPQRALFWQEQGADSITLEDITCNRNFELLGKIRETVKCDLQLLVNNLCMNQCFMAETHKDMAAHDSRACRFPGAFHPDYYSIKCMMHRIRNPSAFINASWIRPEDLVYYEKIGYDNFKLSDRSAPTDVMLARIRAYAARRYDGNLLDLVANAHGGKRPRRGLLDRLARIPGIAGCRPSSIIRLRKYMRLSGMMTFAGKEGVPVSVDNKALDGIMERFASGECREQRCGSCSVCEGLAERHVRIDPSYKAEFLQLANELLQDIETGRFWI